MDFNNLSSVYGWSCIYKYKPWIRTTDFQNNSAFYIAFCVLSIAVSLMSTLSNILLITAILTAPSLKTPSYSLIASQAFSDLLVAFYLATLASFVALGMTEKVKTACDIWQLFTVVSRMSNLTSASSSTLLSIDRYLSMYLCMRYKTVVTMTRVRIAILMAWISGPAAAILSYLILSSFVQIAAMLTVLGILYISSVSFFYFNAFKLLRKHSKVSNNSIELVLQEMGGESSESPPNEIGSNPTTRLEWNKYRKSLWTLIIIEILFLVTMFPAICVLMKMSFKGGHSSNTDRLFLVFSCFIWAFASAINPWIHIYRMNDVRQACRSVLVRLRALIMCFD